MAVDRTTRGRPIDIAKAEAILDAGWALFLAQGVEATSMEAVAARAGVSKVTLYRRFPDRGALFEAALRREMARLEAMQAHVEELNVETSVAERLATFGFGLMAYLSSGPAVDFYAVIAGELRRHPALARAFYDLGPGQTHRNLTHLIDHAMSCGELRLADPQVAAEALFGLWQGFSNFQHALGVDEETDAATLRRRVDEGVRAFLTIYAKP